MTTPAPPVVPQLLARPTWTNDAGAASPLNIALAAGTHGQSLVLVCLATRGAANRWCSRVTDGAGTQYHSLKWGDWREPSPLVHGSIDVFWGVPPRALRPGGLDLITCHLSGNEPGPDGQYRVTRATGTAISMPGCTELAAGFIGGAPFETNYSNAPGVDTGSMAVPATVLAFLAANTNAAPVIQAGWTAVGVGDHQAGVAGNADYINSRLLYTGGQATGFLAQPVNFGNNWNRWGLTAVPVAAPGPLFIYSILPAAEAGSEYNVELVASGGVPPYTWTAAGLPPGITVTVDPQTRTSYLTGTLPAQPGDWIVDLTVTDQTLSTRTVRRLLIATGTTRLYAVEVARHISAPTVDAVVPVRFDVDTPRGALNAFIATKRPTGPALAARGKAKAKAKAAEQPTAKPGHMIFHPPYSSLGPQGEPPQTRRVGRSTQIRVRHDEHFFPANTYSYWGNATLRSVNGTMFQGGDGQQYSYMDFTNVRIPQDAEIEGMWLWMQNETTYWPGGATAALWVARTQNNLATFYSALAPRDQWVFLPRQGINRQIGGLGNPNQLINAFQQGHRWFALGSNGGAVSNPWRTGSHQYSGSWNGQQRSVILGILYYTWETVIPPEPPPPPSEAVWTFEPGIQGWSGWQAGTSLSVLERSNQWAATGSYSLRMVRSGQLTAEWGAVSPAVECEPGASIDVRAVVRAPQALARVGLTVEWLLPGSGTPIARTEDNRRAVNANQNVNLVLTAVNNVIVAGERPTRCRIVVGNHQTGTAGQVLFTDDVDYAITEPPEPVIPYGTPARVMGITDQRDNLWQRISVWGDSSTGTGLELWRAADANPLHQEWDTINVLLDADDADSAVRVLAAPLTVFPMAVATTQGNSATAAIGISQPTRLPNIAVAAINADPGTPDWGRAPATGHTWGFETTLEGWTAGSDPPAPLPPGATLTLGRSTQWANSGTSAANLWLSGITNVPHGFYWYAESPAVPVNPGQLISVGAAVRVFVVDAAVSAFAFRLSGVHAAIAWYNAAGQLIEPLLRGPVLPRIDAASAWWAGVTGHAPPGAATFRVRIGSIRGQWMQPLLFDDVEWITPASPAIDPLGHIRQPLNWAGGQLSLTSLPLEQAEKTSLVATLPSAQPWVLKQFTAAPMMPRVVTVLPGGEPGAWYEVMLYASGGYPPLTWRVEGLPDGLEFIDTPGLEEIVGHLPPNPGGGRFRVLLTVTDDVGAVDVSEQFIVVAWEPPKITGTRREPGGQPEGLPQGITGEPYEAYIEATGGSRPMEWQIENLPPGLYQLQGNGIVGDPTEPGDFAVRVTVTDLMSQSDRLTMPLKINSPYVPPPPEPWRPRLIPVIWDGLDLMPGDREDGLLAVVTDLDWYDSPPLENMNIRRALADGSTWGIKTLAPKIVTVQGAVSGPRPLMIAYRDELARRSIAREPADFTVTDPDHGPLTMSVRADTDRFKYAWIGGDRGFRYEIALTAADPLFYGDWREEYLTTANPDELTGRQYPRSYGWHYVNAATRPRATLANRGNAPAKVQILVTGYLRQVQLTDGQRWIRTVDIHAGTQLLIDSETLAAQAYGGAYGDGQTRSYMILPGSQPMVIPPHSSVEWEMRTGTRPAGVLETAGYITLAWREAWG